MFKTIIKQRPLLFCCILVSFFLAIIQATVVQAATRQTQMPHQALASSPTATATATATPSPTATPGTIMVSPQTVQPGFQITVTGTGWPAGQSLTVQIAPQGAQSDVVAYSSPTADAGGNFSTTISIPPNSATGVYQLAVIVTSQPLVAQTTTFMVTAVTPTPSPSPSPSPSPTPSPTATATPVPGNSNGGGGGGGLGVTILIFILGSLGVILIVIGVVMFAASPPSTPSPNARMR